MGNFTETTEPQTILICADCLILEANGELPEDRPDLLADIDTHTGDLQVTLGRMRTEDVVSDIHTEDTGCPWRVSEETWDPDLWGLCTCEDWDDSGFSWSSCEECGSHLGGDRYYATVWVPVPLEEMNR